MQLVFKVKSGTGGYYDSDGCDLLICKQTMDEPILPRIGDHLSYYGRKFVVIEVEHVLDAFDYMHNIYCVPIDGGPADAKL